MPRGDAFNRDEVTSTYVKPSSRYVVSLIIGIDPNIAGSPEAAVREALEMTRSTDACQLSWHVFDRETGFMKEVPQGEVEHEAGHDPFPPKNT